MNAQSPITPAPDAASGPRKLVVRNPIQELADLEACRTAIRTGSLSFHAASRLLPARVRDPALVLYAFCRLADDAVDEGSDAVDAVLRLQERLDRAYAGRPANQPEDRAFTRMVVETGMPRKLPDALLEGFAWDAQGRRFASLSDVLDYSARVAATVGVMMAVLMGVRDRHRLARAADLGLAMQLTNIARDVGEDARAGRVYLPTDWMAEAGIDIDAFLRTPAPVPEVRAMVKRLLREAGRLYERAEPGIAALPAACRPGIFAARHIYAGIGGQVRAAGFDSVTRRARTSGAQKTGWLAVSGLHAGLSLVQPKLATLYAHPRPEVAFLVHAAADPAADFSRSDALMDTLSRLRATDLARRHAAAATSGATPA